MRSIMLRALVIALAACAHHQDVTQDANGNCDPADPTCVPFDACADCTDVHTFASASLIIPMDLSYQATGAFQAYGLVYQLLRQNVHIYWVIDPNKTYHSDAC